MKYYNRLGPVAVLALGLLDSPHLNSHSIMGVQAQELYACAVDADCLGINEAFICVDNEDKQDGEPDKICEHKPLFPLWAKEWIGTFIFSFIMLLSNVGGIGGGGIAIPIAMYFFNLSLKPAIAISSFSILWATCARFVYNINEKHPEKPNTVSIDYYLTNVMMPLTLIGSLCGTFMYRAFPDLILQIVLTILLLCLVIISGKKWRQIHKKETKALEEKKLKESEAKTNSVMP